MEDIVKRILELDKQARKVTLNADELKRNADKEVNQKIEDIKNNYFNRAEQKIKDIEQKERNLAREKLEQKEIKNERILNGLDRAEKHNKDKWAQEIFDNIIK